MLQSVGVDWPDFAGRTYQGALISRGPLLWMSGLNAIQDGGVEDPDDLAAQVRVIYSKLGTILAQCNSGPGNVVKTTDYIVSRTNYAKTAEVRRDFFGSHRPTSTGVVVSELLGRGVLIEIDAIAVLPE